MGSSQVSSIILPMDTSRPFTVAAPDFSSFALTTKPFLANLSYLKHQFEITNLSRGLFMFRKALKMWFKPQKTSVGNRKGLLMYVREWERICETV
jgi:hypothetical protein